MGESHNKRFDYLCDTIKEFSGCMDDFLYVYDLQSDRYFISPSALKRFRIDSALFSNVGEEHRKFVYEKDYQMLMDDLQRVIDGLVDNHNLVYRWLDPKGHPVWINCRGKSIRDENGKPLFMIGCINEIGRYPVADEVSGLLTNIVIKDLFQSNSPYANVGSILCIAIDDLQHINEWGDTTNSISVIHDVVHCIQKEVSESQMVYRLFRDQFLILDDNPHSLADPLDLYNRIQKRIEMKIEQNAYRELYTISAGIIPEKYAQKMNYDTMTNVAQFVLEMMKQRGDGSVYLYNEEDYRAFLEQKHLLVDLRKSMLNHCDRFEVYFQPIVEGEDLNIYAAEALLRFHRSDGKIVSPNEFIPLLEKSGLIVPVGKWVLHQALSFCKEIRNYRPKFKVGVNLSYVQILKTNIVETIELALKEFDLPPSCLVVEMTESGYLDHSNIVNKVWKELKELGVKNALDDFGTGYSNLSSVGILLPHTIKLDREFTLRAVNNSYERLLMHHMIELTHSLNCKACIEGIETEQELEIAKELGVDSIQGYYFGKPCPKDDFLKIHIL